VPELQHLRLGLHEIHVQYIQRHDRSVFTAKPALGCRPRRPGVSDDAGVAGGLNEVPQPVVVEPLRGRR